MAKFGSPALETFRWMHLGTRAPSQYPKRRLSVRSRQVSKPRDLYLELSDRSEIWQALRQQCCRCACQISKRYDNLKYQSRGFETLRDLTKRRLFGYWDGALQHKLIHDLLIMWIVSGELTCSVARNLVKNTQSMNINNYKITSGCYPYANLIYGSMEIEIPNRSRIL